MKVLFIVNIPSPYRVDFFNILGTMCELTVCFQGKIAAGRDDSWKNNKAVNYNEIFLNNICFKGKCISFEIINLLRKNFDHIVVSAYSEPTPILAIEYMRIMKIPFWIEADGGIVKQDKRPLFLLKKHLISSASGWLSSGKYTTEYFLHYGAICDKTFVYPFTSLQEKDILKKPPTKELKAEIKKELGIKCQKVLLAVGQFIPRKGFDILLKAFAKCDKSTSLYIVGAQPPQEYLNLKRDLLLDNVIFVGFQNKQVLKKYYQAADVFVLPTREDIWGLVINEAMANALPIITTNKCVAGLELIKDGENGYIVPVGNENKLAETLDNLLCDDELIEYMSAKSLHKILKYNIENMAVSHINIFKSNMHK